MLKPPPPAPATARREFLRLLALTPAALAAGCAGAKVSAPAKTGTEASRPAAAAAPDPLAPIRSAPLPMDAEPAFVFRAAPARPGE
jgi:hypothetical protein